MGEIIKLDVGGHLYTTTRSTLTRYPDSRLGAMFSWCAPYARDRNGAYIIDGDGPIFRYVLNFLRRGKLNLPEDFKDWDLLVSEADFYQIPEFVDAVTTAKSQGSRQKDDGCQNADFIQISLKEASTRNHFMYTGSPDILKTILPTLQAFEEESDGEVDVCTPFSSVERYGSWTMSIYGGNYSFEAVRMDIFQQLYQVGFELITSSVHHKGDKLGTEKTWLLGRKVK